MNNYKIYVHINKINGKIYIGQTCRKNVKARFGKNGIQYQKCPRFWNAIQKYGWENFEHIVLIENLTQEIADIIEIELIEKYKSCNTNFGYNLAPGGRTGSGKSLWKVIYQYDIYGNFIRKWISAQHAACELGIIASNISACCLGISKTCKGFVWSYIPLDKEYFDNITISHGVRIKQYDKYGNYIKTFKSIKEASKETGIGIGNISTSCQKKGGNLTNGLYRWTYEYDEIDKSKIKKPDNQRPVTQYDLQGNIIKKWNSMIEASRELNILCTKINSCCKGREKTYHGYIWRFTDENIEKITNIEEYLKRKKSISRKIQEGKRVAQYSIYDEFIKIWNSSSEATEYYGGAKNTTNIQACCRGAKKSAFGFKWKYVD